MKKTLQVLILLLIISCTAVFSILYVTFNLIEPDNVINKTFRNRVLSSTILRTLLRLQQVGDARYEYMYKRGLPLEVYIYYQEGTSLQQQTIAKIASQMQFATHKSRPVLVHDPQILTAIPEKTTDKDIGYILDTYNTQTSLFSPTAKLHIFVLRYYLPHSSYAGLVENANAMFLFTEAMNNVSEGKDSLVAIEISTILHEFAHLGGAEHITNTECILADTVENLDFFTKITSIRDSYCTEDLDAINKALQF